MLLFFPDAERGQGPGPRTTSRRSRRRRATCTIEEHDRFVDAELAGKYKVTKDGVIVLVRGTGDKEKSQTIEVDTDIEKARNGASKLRNFDREVNSVADEARAREAQGVRDDRPRRDQRSRLGAARAQGQGARAPHEVFKKRLGELNYEVKDLGLIDLAKDVHRLPAFLPRPDR